MRERTYSGGNYVLHRFLCEIERRDEKKTTEIIGAIQGPKRTQNILK